MFSDLWSGPRFSRDKKKRYPLRFFARFNLSILQKEGRPDSRERVFYFAPRKERRRAAGLTGVRRPLEQEEEGKLVGKEDEWATSYDDKLGRSFADVRAICASEIIPSR